MAFGRRIKLAKKAGGKTAFTTGKATRKQKIPLSHVEPTTAEKRAAKRKKHQEDQQAKQTKADAKKAKADAKKAKADAKALKRKNRLAKAAKRLTNKDAKPW